MRTNGARKLVEVHLSQRMIESMREQWLVFYYGKKELATYTLRGTIPGEAEATAELLAYENNITKEDIRMTIETRGDRS